MIISYMRLVFILEHNPMTIPKTMIEILALLPLMIRLKGHGDGDGSMVNEMGGGRVRVRLI